MVYMDFFNVAAASQISCVLLLEELSMYNSVT